MDNFDLVVVGGGPAGYVAALRAAKYGMKIALVEKDYLGGTCLNRGCIPSKTMLRHSEVIEDIKNAQHWGIITTGISFSYEKMKARKNEVIEILRNGINQLLQTGDITVYDGEASIYNNKQVKVKLSNGDLLNITGKHVLIATGSKPVVPPIKGLDSINYHTTDTIFDLEEIPSSMTIIGGGVIGVEMANIFSSLGTKVTIVEMEDRIISTEDKDASRELLKSLKRKGISVLTKHQVMAISDESSIKKITVHSQKGEEKILESAEVLIAVGREPNLTAINSLDVKMNNSFIEVDKYFETSIDGIYAAGDVIGGLQLAHVASAEGLTSIENMCGNQKSLDYHLMPRCIYTKLEVASVGFSEQELINNGTSYNVKKYDFTGNGKALAMGDREGFVKVLTDPKYGEILGVTMVGSRVTEIIGQSASYIQLEGTLDELADLTQAHPSMSEGLMESANALIGKGIHFN